MSHQQEADQGDHGRQDLATDDPRIYNNGDPGDGDGKRPGCLSGWLRLFRR